MRSIFKSHFGCLLVILYHVFGIDYRYELWNKTFSVVSDGPIVSFFMPVYTPARGTRQYPYTAGDINALNPALSDPPLTDVFYKLIWQKQSLNPVPASKREPPGVYMFTGVRVKLIKYKNTFGRGGKDVGHLLLSFRQ